jgi:hypothetical protein
VKRPVAAAEERPPVTALAEIAKPEPEEAETETAAPIVPSDLQGVLGQWSRVVAEVKAKSMLAGAILQAGRPVKLHGDEVEFLLGPGMTRFHADQIDQTKNKTIVESVMHSVLGRRLALHVVVEGASAAPSGPLFKDKPPTKDLAGDPKVKKVMDSFPGSKIVGIE